MHFLAAETARAAAAIHRRVAAAEHDDALADLVDVSERDRRQPVDADVDVLRRFATTGDVEIAATRGAAADEHGIESFAQQRLHARDLDAWPELDAEIEHIADLFVDHHVRQPELGDLGSHHAAGGGIAIEHHAVVTERHEIARDGQRRRTCADQRDALSVLDGDRLGQAIADVVLEIRRGALQPADRHRLGTGLRLAVLDRPFLHARAPACRLARPVTGAAEDPGKDIRLPVDQIRVVVASLGNQADVFGDRRVGGTGPLAIDDLVKVVGVRNIGRLQASVLLVARPRFGSCPTAVKTARARVCAVDRAIARSPGPQVANRMLRLPNP